MTRAEFDLLKNFSLRERNHKGESLCNTESVGLINLELMQYLDALTSDIKRVFKGRNPACIIHYITAGTHTKTSAHPKGLAVDCHFTGLGLYEQVMMASLYPFTGIGFYPYDTPPFVHLDLKSTDMRRRMWYRTYDREYVDYRDIQEVFRRLRGVYKGTIPMDGSD